MAEKKLVEEPKRDPYACDCCGKVELTKDMIQRLEQLQLFMGDKIPVVANGYHCQKKTQANPFHDSGPHAEGRAVSFEAGNQYMRHLLLGGALGAFNQVWIYPNRVTVISDYDGPPMAITVL